mgnify:CR=1 FL=1
MIEIPRNKNNQKYIVIFSLILIFSTTFFIIYKYHVEGEKNLPFNITKLVVVSSAKTQDIELNENMYQANVIQENHVYLAIEKNEKYSKEDAIKKITFNNFKIIENGKKGTVKFYRTSTGNKEFEYNNNFEINNNIEYIGSKETNLKAENMTIANQGGLIELSIAMTDLGKITYLENDNIVADGTLLNRLQISNEEIKNKISFDMIMELTEGNKFKTTIILDLPAEGIIEKGVSTNQDIDLSKLVFKRF